MLRRHDYFKWQMMIVKVCSVADSTKFQREFGILPLSAAFHYNVCNPVDLTRRFQVFEKSFQTKPQGN